MASIDIDRVPADVLAAARRAFGLRDREAELLDLTADTAVEPTGHPPRRLQFGSGDTTVTVEVTEARDGQRSLSVASERAEPQHVEIDGGQARVPLVLLPTGQHEATSIAPGLVSVVLHADDRRLRTSWTRV